MKMLAIVMGINAANSVQPCTHCKCPASEFHDTSKVWSITDSNLGARTVENALESVGKDGQLHEPIITFIPFYNFVPDLLHLNLRISEVLFEHVFNELVKLDWNTKTRRNIFLNYLVEKFKIKNPVYEAKGKICLRSFSRDENLLILSKMPLTNLFKDLDKVANIEKCWRDFFDINMALIQNAWKPEEIRVKTKDWLDSLTKKCYGKDIVTLYMHHLQQHMHQFAEVHGNVNLFNCQSLEKKNHLNTKNLFQSTNLHTNLTEKDDCLVQLVKKNNRIDHLNVFPDHELTNQVRVINNRRINFVANFRSKQPFT